MSIAPKSQTAQTWSQQAERFAGKWRNPIYQHIHAREWGLLQKLIGDARTVLDIGCGHGRLLAEIGERGIGLEFASGMLRVAKQKARNRKLVAGDAEHLPFKSGSVDCVLLSEVLPYAPQPERVLAEASRVLRTRGRIAVSYLNAWSMPSQAIAEALRVAGGAMMERDWLYHPRKVARMLRQAGFRNIEHHAVTYVPWIRVPFWRTFAALEFLGPLKGAGLKVFKWLDAHIDAPVLARYALTVATRS